MTKVIDLKEFKRKKEDKKRNKDVSGTSGFSYTGKLAEAMRKYGSSTGNVMKDLFGKKKKKEEGDDVL